VILHKPPVLAGYARATTVLGWQGFATPHTTRPCILRTLAAFLQCHGRLRQDHSRGSFYFALKGNFLLCVDRGIDPEEFRDVAHGRSG